jgi:hypothetical protein
VKPSRDDAGARAHGSAVRACASLAANPRG